VVENLDTLAYPSLIFSTWPFRRYHLCCLPYEGLYNNSSSGKDCRPGNCSQQSFGWWPLYLWVLLCSRENADCQSCWNNWWCTPCSYSEKIADALTHLMSVFGRVSPQILEARDAYIPTLTFDMSHLVDSVFSSIIDYWKILPRWHVYLWNASC